MGRSLFDWRRLAISSLAVLLPLAAFSQVPGITVSPGTEISSDRPADPHAETFLAINPRNPNNLIATSIAIENGHAGSAVYASFDGGKTWKHARTTTPDNTIFKGGDPIAYFDPQGTAFFGALQGTPIGFLLSRSTDGGLTWGLPVTIPGGTHDREYLAFDDTGGEFSARMYAGATVSAFETDDNRFNAIHVVYSTDGGRSFSEGHVMVRSQGGEAPFAIGEMLVAPDGTLIVPFSALAVPASGASSSPGSRLCGHLWVTLSRDGANTFSPATQGPAFCWPSGYDNLKTMVAAPQAAIDLSQGPHRGRIFLAYTDFEGKKDDVKVVHSDDLGKTWTAPVTVNDNTGTDSPANPAIAVNEDGIVGVAWNDRRDDPKNSCFRLYFAVSGDGGDTFLPNVRASSEPTCPLAAGNWGVYAASYFDITGKSKPLPAIFMMNGVPGRWPNGGDTQGLLAGPDGVFHSAWINGDGATGVTELWHKEFRVDPAALPHSALSVSREDLSGKLTLKISDARVDFATNTVAVRVRLENPLLAPVAGPFTVVLNDLQTSLKGMSVVNADNHLSGKGAFWNFQVPPGNVLQPKQQSAWREFEWKFTGGRPSPPGRALYAHFLILGRKKP